jgi:hypothetical protein
MLHSLEIEGFRCFNHFAMPEITRVNLLVGRNNCGKSALLEAVELIASRGQEVRRLWRSLSERGEVFPEEESRARYGPEYDISHLFTGHEVGVGSAFRLFASVTEGQEHLRCDVRERGAEPSQQEVQPALFESDRQGELGFPGGRLALSISSEPPESQSIVPLTSRFGLPYDWMRRGLRAPILEERALTTFITTESLREQQVEVFWKDIALTRGEQLAIEALRLLEPSIERIAYVGGTRSFRSTGRGGIAVKCRDSGRRIPIGSMGDGLWRMLGLALALTRSEGGVVLIDEIDTGLHYSVMRDMWEMVMATAQRLNLQVFATTHSSDCISSLAFACKGAAPRSAAIHRIDWRNEGSVVLSEREMLVAAERGIEVR